MALIAPDGDFHPAVAPGVVPGNAHGAVGEVLRHLGDQLVAPGLRRRLPEEGQGDGEDLRHLRRGGTQGPKARRGRQAQHRAEQKAPLIADEVRLAQEGKDYHE